MEQQQHVAVNGKNIIRRTEEEILKHLSDQEQSGFSVKEYCEMYEILEQTFYSWIKKYRNRSEEEIKGFDRIEVVPAFSSSKPQLFAEVGSVKLYKEVSAEYLKALLS
jgi:hypothetical protein